MASRVRRRRRKPHHSRWHKLAIPLGAILAVILVVGGIAAAWAIDIYNSAPPLSSLKPVEKGRSSAIYAADGSLIGFIRSENIRQPVPSSALPQVLKEATVAIEDKNFYGHGALDPAGIVRAAVKDIEAGGKPVQGASTITQQLVRNLYIQHPEDTLERKITEASLANELFDRYSRDWILKEYLNTAPYGTVEGQTAVGAEAAAQTYFGEPAKDLELREAALIAGLPQAPSEYNPFLDPKAALERRNEVLKAMWEQGYITGTEFEETHLQGLGLNPGHKYRVIKDPFLFDLVQQELINEYGINTVRNGGLKAYTSINPRLQEKAEAAVATCYDCYPGSKAAALASVDPNTGAIVALASTAGGESETQFNYAWQAHRQPGSSFKTYVLTTAIRQGIDPATTYYDGTSPITLEIPGGGPPWEVHNAEPGGGVMSLEAATWDSVNVIFAQLDLDVGPEAVTETAEEMGIESPLESVPAEAIGGLAIGVTPLEMADGYATLANGGVHHDPTAISKVVFPKGKVDEPGADAGDRVLTPGQAYEVTRILEGVITQGTGAGYTYMGCSSEAGKTGTSEGESDAWFVGYTPMYSTAVWVGHPQSREYTGFGGPTAGPIWRSYMESAQEGDCPEFEAPSTLPSLSGYSSEHTRSSSEAGSGFEEGEEEEEETETGKKPKKEAGEEGEEEGEEGAEEAEPEPTAAPPNPEPTGPPPAVGGGISPG
ncbi:MAG TPA: transglycosylase domain-containing protein [Solirubrobacterales bacterium]|jgi:penicillin-binding protein 1A|nr:transglycosylase domain-containing protein [Solirubrobacterales bacterium]